MAERKNPLELPTSDEVAYGPASVYGVFKDGSEKEILDMLPHYKIYSIYIYENGDTLAHAVLRNMNLKEVCVTEILTLIFTQDANPNIQNAEGETLLHLAVVRRMRNTVDFLIESAADLYAMNKNGDTLAHYFIKDEYKKLKHMTENPYIKISMEHYKVIENDSMNFLEFLISKHLDFDLQNNQGESALLLAISYYLQHYLPILFEYTRDIKVVDEDKRTLLDLFLEKRAIARQSELFHENPYSNYNPDYAVKCVKILLERGVPDAIFDRFGRSLIRKAFNENQGMVLMKTYIDHYLNNCYDDHYASNIFHVLLSTCEFWSTTELSEYFLMVLSELIAKGADVNWDRFGKRPVHFAQNFIVLEFLHENGTDFSLRSKHGKTLLHLLAEQTPIVESNHDVRTEAWCLTVYGDYDVNVTCKSGRTPLHSAAAYGNVPMIRALIDIGAEINCKDENSRTPLHEAVMMGHSVELVQLFLTNGADVNAIDSKGYTPLHFAADNRNAPIARLLIEHRAEVNCKTKYFMQTPLHRAAINGKTSEIVQLLITNGADVNAKDYKDKTPF